ncbi:hypothetical protein ACOSQ4_020608 [Xanthoceras sorbifolium]
MNQRHPEFVQKLEKYELIYTRFLNEDDDFSFPTGVSTFWTEDKSVAEETCEESDPSTGLLSWDKNWSGWKMVERKE